MSEANDAVTSPVEHIIMCETPTIPTAKKYRGVQYSIIKRRSGKESVQFLGLKTGTYRVKFYNDKREAILTVKTWLSPYGWAWMIVDA